MSQRHKYPKLCEILRRRYNLLHKDYDRLYDDYITLYGDYTEANNINRILYDKLDEAKERGRVK